MKRINLKDTHQKALIKGQELIKELIKGHTLKII